MIPKTILQTSRSNNLPSIFQKIKDENEKVNNFAYKLWHHDSGEMNIDEFIKKEYGHLYDIYSKSQYGVQKADIIRLVLLHYYGGIYIDTDILFLKSMDTLIDYESDNVYIAMEPMEQTKKLYNNENVICNAFIAGPAKHPLFKEALDEILRIYQRFGDNIFKVFNVFGGDLISKAMQSGNIFDSCKFVNRKLIYPINDPKFTDLPSSIAEAEMIKKGEYGNAYAVHYWIHSDFESKELLEKFIYNNNENLHQNMVRFFKELYVNNHNLK